MLSADRLLKNTPRCSDTKDIITPNTANPTAIPANGTTATFIAKLPKETRSNTLAAIGAPAIHAAREIPNAPNIHDDFL
jgi:hypothetical protein